MGEYGRPQMRAQRFSTIVKGVVLETTAGDIANATAVDFRNFAGGHIICPPASAIASTTFTFYGCDTSDGTFLPIYSSGGVAVAATGPGSSTDCMIELPAALFGVPFFKILSNADDTETVDIALKS